MSPDCPAVLGDDQLPVEELAVLSPGQHHLALHHVRLFQHPARLRGVARSELQQDFRPLAELPVNPHGGAGGQFGQILQLSSPGYDDQSGGGLWIHHACSNKYHPSELACPAPLSPTEQETLTVFSLT